MTELAVGSIAPDFSLQRTDGQTVRLKDLRGQKVVLFFYPKDNTEACTLEAIDFSRLDKEFAEAGAAVLGISPDSLKKHANFTAKHALSVSLLSDPELSAIHAYGLWIEKTLYGRKYMGVERATFVIDRKGIVAAMWRKVRVRDHAAEVLEAVRALKRR